MVTPNTTPVKESASTAARKNNSALRYLLPVAVIICILLIWFFISYTNLFPAYALPSPGSVLKSFQEELLAGRLINDIIASLWRVAVGFVISATLAFRLVYGWDSICMQGRLLYLCLISFVFFHHLPGYHLLYSGFISVTSLPSS